MSADHEILKEAKGSESGTLLLFGQLLLAVVVVISFVILLDFLWV